MPKSKEAPVDPLVFFPAYYLRLYPDVRAALGPDKPQKAYDHFRSIGMDEGRSPNPFLLPAFYLETHQDLLHSYGHMNYRAAVHHWMHHGFMEGRRGSAVFHIGHYLSFHSDLQSAFGKDGFAKAFRHWRSTGLREGRSASPDGPALQIQPGDKLSEHAIALLQTCGSHLPPFVLGEELLAGGIPYR